MKKKFCCRDEFGRCALELALIGCHESIVDYLLPRSNVQCVEDALFYAIDTDNVKMAELILSHPLYSSARIDLSKMDAFYEHDIDSPRPRQTASPLALASHRNNFYLGI